MLLGSKELDAGRKYGVCFTEVSGRALVFWISGRRFGHGSAGAGALSSFEDVAGVVSCPRLSTSPPFPWWALHLPELFLLSMGGDDPHIRPAEIAEKKQRFFWSVSEHFFVQSRVSPPCSPVLSAGLPKYLIISSETFPWSDVRHV